ncbi:DUF1598 domain-containing protein [Candidatus Sumerlaeota bacterium]|nr:DUF1598 domain-containing protein [Candidatus Sumerlaeota bacterium]
MEIKIRINSFYKKIFAVRKPLGLFSTTCFLFISFFARTAPATEIFRSFDPARSGARICLSLRVLMNQARLDPRKTQVKELAGIGWIEGYVIDAENRDIILIGRRHPNWPYIHLDDLAATVRNVWSNNPDPYCSLDPKPEDIRKLNQVSRELSQAKGSDRKQDVLRRFKKVAGPQMVVIGGAPRNSRFAHIMIDADYHMKKLSNAFVSLPGITSCLDLQLQIADQLIKKGGNPDLGLSMSRFWFHVSEDDPVFQEEEGIVWLDSCSVTVLTEKQRAGSDGELYDSGEDDPISRQFAGNLTHRFREVSHRVPVYAQLENLFRLNALLRALHLKNAARDAQLDIRYLLQQYDYQAEYPMPDSLEGLANVKELKGRERKGNRIQEYTLYSLACGGVSMEMPLQKDRFIKPPDSALGSIRNQILSSRPSRDALSWILP